jgi:hypothetical protein
VETRFLRQVEQKSFPEAFGDRVPNVGVIYSLIPSPLRIAVVDPLFPLLLRDQPNSASELYLGAARHWVELCECQLEVDSVQSSDLLATSMAEGPEPVDQSLDAIPEIDRLRDCTPEDFFHANFSIKVNIIECVVGRFGCPEKGKENDDLSNPFGGQSILHGLVDHQTDRVCLLVHFPSYVLMKESMKDKKELP